MAATETSTGADALSSKGEQSPAPLVAWLKDQVLPGIIPALVTAGAFLGLVTLAGGAMAWARFSAVGLPAIDIVSVLPRSHLLVLGALSLLSVAVAASLVLGFSYALGGILIGGKSNGGSAGNSTAEGPQQAPSPADGSRDSPVGDPVASMPPAAQKARPRFSRDARLLLCVVVLLVAVTVVDAVAFELWGRDLVILIVISAAVATIDVGLVLGVSERDQDLRVFSRLLIAAAVWVTCAIVVLAAISGAIHAWHVLIAGLAAANAIGVALVLPPSVWIADVLRARRGKHIATGPLLFAVSDKPGTTLPADVTFQLKDSGRVLLSAVAVIGIAAALALMDNNYVALTLVVALVLLTVLFTFARKPSRRQGPVAIAIAAVVLSFGLMVSVTKTLDDPKMPWVAVVRSADVPSADWGLYIVETDDRLWIAKTVAHSDNKIHKEATRLYWINRDEIAEIRMGATTHVNDALTAAYRECLEITSQDASCGESPHQLSEKLDGQRSRTSN